MIKRLWIVEGVLVLAGAVAVVVAVTTGPTRETRPSSLGENKEHVSANPSESVGAEAETRPDPGASLKTAKGVDGFDVAIHDARPFAEQVGAYLNSGSAAGDRSGETDRRQTDGHTGTSPDEAEVPLADRDPAEVAQDLLKRIADATSGKLEEQDLLAIAILRDSDIDVAKLLKDEYFKPASGKAVDVVRNSVILKALGCLDTPQARQTLLDIACAEQPNAQTLGPRAVQALAGSAKDPDEIALALRAPHSATRDAAAQAMAKRSLSEGAIDALAAQMSSSSWVTQNLVATAFATDTSDTGAASKIQAVLANYRKLGERVDDKQAVPAGVFWIPTEMARSSYVSSLARMKGAKEDLERQLAQASAAEREPLLLALGHRGVTSVRPELLKMAKGAEDGFVRTMAVNSLYLIATDEDKTLLRQLAANDTYKRTVSDGRNGESSVFPVRDAARQVLEKLDRN